jgi:hypothetical protein
MLPFSLRWEINMQEILEKICLCISLAGITLYLKFQWDIWQYKRYVKSKSGPFDFDTNDKNGNSR